MRTREKWIMDKCVGVRERETDHEKMIENERKRWIMDRYVCDKEKERERERWSKERCTFVYESEIMFMFLIELF